jgi:hypothetical protein
VVARNGGCRARGGGATPRAGWGSGARHHEPGFVGGHNRLSVVVQHKFVQHPAHMGLDRLLGDDQACGVSGLDSPRCGEAEHVGFAWGVIAVVQAYDDVYGGRPVPVVLWPSSTARMVQLASGHPCPRSRKNNTSTDSYWLGERKTNQLCSAHPGRQATWRSGLWRKHQRRWHEINLCA